MNNNVISSRVQMEPGLLQQLVAQVKETVATEIKMQKNENSSSFKAINLWSIRRNGRFVSNGNKRKKITSLSVTHVSF
ncbi:MAG: hypothetical protein ABJB86_02580 [Bacteroidota bacterium]